MDGDGVRAIVGVAKEAAIPKPQVLEGPGFKKLAHLSNDESGFGWVFDELPCHKPTSEEVLLHTLSGFAAYVSANRDERVLAECSVVVRDHANVLLVGKEHGELPQRDVYVAARFEDLIKADSPGLPNIGSPFGFGNWMPPEAFNIAMQTLFVPDADRARVLEIVGNVRTEGVTTFDDDGITQGVVASAGVRIGKVVSVPNPVTLAPYRTFREISQPPSLFVLRMQGEPGQMPRIALYEADGGAWKVECINRIADYLRPLLPAEVVVVA